MTHLITPLTPYFICNHFISRELDSTSEKYVKMEIKVTANNLLKYKNYDTIKSFDTIQVQVDHLDFFQDEILPLLHEKK